MNIGLEQISLTSTAQVLAQALDCPSMITDTKFIILAVTRPAPGGIEPCDVGTALDAHVQNFNGRALVAQAAAAGDQGTPIILETRHFGNITYTVYRVGSGDSSLLLWHDRDAREKIKQYRECGEKSVAILSGFSHEARNPLHAVLGYTECLLNPQSENLTPTQRDYCANILQSGKHLLWLCEQLEDFARLESGRVTMDVDPVDVHDLLDTSSMLVRERAARKDIELILDEPGEVMPTIFADGRRIATVLINLLVNAIKFTPRGGRVTAGVRFLAGDAYFLVSDTGIGIETSHQEAIFEPFDRGEFQFEGEFGSGIGLALAKRIVEMHSGEITVQSRPGEGSLFIVRIPTVANADGVAGALPSPAHQDMHWGGIV
ncbi:MAG: HAMP domain-containing histidine kinase [Planctomycetes bacterium]|nr:HAMP domain-containing histidine kinase [Planctomycetota bacterium]